MTVLEIKLASMVVHLAEALSADGHPFDVQAAIGLLQDSELQTTLRPGPLIPATRSGKPVVQLLLEIRSQ